MRRLASVLLLFACGEAEPPSQTENTDLTDPNVPSESVASPIEQPGGAHPGPITLQGEPGMSTMAAPLPPGFPGPETDEPRLDGEPFDLEPLDLSIIEERDSVEVAE